MSNKDVMRFNNCRVLKETMDTILVDIPDVGREVWIPKMHVDDDSEVYATGTEGELVIPRWFATRENLG